MGHDDSSKRRTHDSCSGARRVGKYKNFHGSERDREQRSHFRPDGNTLRVSNFNNIRLVINTYMVINQRYFMHSVRRMDRNENNFWYSISFTDNYIHLHARLHGNRRFCCAVCYCYCHNNSNSGNGKIVATS